MDEDISGFVSWRVGRHTSENVRTRGTLQSQSWDILRYRLKKVRENECLTSLRGQWKTGIIFIAKFDNKFHQQMIQVGINCKREDPLHRLRSALYCVPPHAVPWCFRRRWSEQTKPLANIVLRETDAPWIQQTTGWSPEACGLHTVIIVVRICMLSGHHIDERPCASLRREK